MSGVAAGQPLLSESARDLLRRAVLDGTLLPGEQLSDAELIAWLGVSRTPIRAALDDLAEVGLVELSANRWTRVACPSPAEVALDVEIWAGLLGVLVRRTEWSPGRVRLVRRLLGRAGAVVEGLGAGPVATPDLVRVAAPAVVVARWSQGCASRALVDASARSAVGLAALGATVPPAAWRDAHESSVAALAAGDPDAFAAAATDLARAVLAEALAGSVAVP